MTNKMEYLKKLSDYLTTVNMFLYVSWIMALINFIFYVTYPTEILEIFFIGFMLLIGLSIIIFQKNFDDLSLIQWKRGFDKTKNDRRTRKSI